MLIRLSVLLPIWILNVFQRIRFMLAVTLYDMLAERGFGIFTRRTVPSVPIRHRMAMWLSAFHGFAPFVLGSHSSFLINQLEAYSQRAANLTASYSYCYLLRDNTPTWSHVNVASKITPCRI